MSQSHVRSERSDTVRHVKSVSDASARHVDLGASLRHVRPAPTSDQPRRATSLVGRDGSDGSDGRTPPTGAHGVDPTASVFTADLRVLLLLPPDVLRVRADSVFEVLRHLVRRLAADQAGG